MRSNEQRECPPNQTLSRSGQALCRDVASHPFDEQLIRSLLLLPLMAILCSATPQSRATAIPPALKPLPDLDLCATDGPPDVFEGVSKLALMGTDRVAFTRWNDHRITICDATGKVLRELPTTWNPAKLVGLGRNRVLLAGDPIAAADGKKYALWIGGTDLEAMLPFAECTTGTVEDVVALPDLSCVAVVVEPSPGGPDLSILRFFDAYGGLRFSIDLPFSKSRRELCIAGGDRIGVVEKDAPQRVTWYDVDGRLQSSIELDASDGPRDSIVSALMQGPNGGFFAQVLRLDPDASGWTPWLRRFDDRGRMVRDVAPHWIDGLPVRSWLFEGPDHTPWTFDEYAVLRVGFDGVATVQFGEPRDAGRLRRAHSVRAGPDGAIYALAERDSALHMFDSRGAKLERILPTKYLGRKGRMWGSHEEGQLPSAFDWLRRGWLGPSKNGLHFEIQLGARAARRVHLVDARGNSVRNLEPPAGFEDEPQPCASYSAEDGSIAVVWRPLKLGSWRPIARCYDSDGALMRSFLLPLETRRVHDIAWDGERIAAVDDLHIWVLDTHARILADGWSSADHTYSDVEFLTCGNAPDIAWRVDFGNAGREIWLRRGDSSTTFQRYALP